MKDRGETPMSKTKTEPPASEELGTMLQWINEARKYLRDNEPVNAYVYLEKIKDKLEPMWEKSRAVSHD